MPDRAKIFIANPDYRVRLDAYLAREMGPEYSRSQILKAIKVGLVAVNDRPARASDPVRRGDRIQFRAPQVQPVAVPATAPEIDVLFADADIIFVNKPPGMAVHPSAGHPHSTLVDALVARFPELAEVTELDGSWRAGIVHRLDKDTSGVMVVARNSFTRAALSEQFKQRTVEKVYLAVVAGHLDRGEITIKRPIGRHPTQRKRMSVKSRTPRDAVSEVTVLSRCDLELSDGMRTAVSVLAVQPRTGRTHQIRVHLSSIGHPCLGDPLYGKPDRQPLLPIKRQALHAYYLAIDHPRTHERTGYYASIPTDLADLLRCCGIEAGEWRSHQGYLIFRRLTGSD